MFHSGWFAAVRPSGVIISRSEELMTHFWAGDNVACGGKWVKKSTEAEEVECGNCKRTKAYKAALPVNRPTRLFAK